MQFFKQKRKIVPSDVVAGSITGYSVSIDGTTAVFGAPGVSTGFAYVYVLNSGIWTLQQKLSPSDGLAADFFGCSVAISGDTIIVGSQWHDTPFAGCGAAYVYTRTAGVWTEQQKLTASIPIGDAYFGWSVSIDGDTCIVGAPYDDTAVLQDGSAFVFVRSGGVWSEEEKLTAFDPFLNDYYGWSVSVSGDTCAIGSYQDDDLGGGSGSTYVYTRALGVWTLEQKLTASDGVAGNMFGYSVSLDEDALLVSAPFANANKGQVYYFTRAGIVWTESQKLKAGDGALSDWYGNSICLSGDRCIIGAHGDDDKGSFSGSAYIYSLAAGTWSLSCKVKAVDGVADDYFGQAVSIYDDLIIIGARNDDDLGLSSGAIYLFDPLTVSDPLYQQKVISSDGEANDEFGCSIAISADTCVVGARRDDDKGNNAGAAYVFVQASGVWSQQQKLLASDGAGGMMFGDSFGEAVAIDGDTCVIGASGKNSGEGAAYVFTRTAGVWTEQQKLLASDHAGGFLFGYSVAIDGDTCVLGSIYSETLAVDIGAAYVFTRSAGVWTEQQKLIASDGLTGDEFGSSVSVNSDTCIVGASYADAPGADSGAAYAFTRLLGIWTEQQKLTASDGAAGDEFGISVGLDGETCVIGARWNVNGGIDTGSAYVFLRSFGTWTEQQKLYPKDGASGDRYGTRVGISGDFVVVGSPLDDDTGGSSGSAYIYFRYNAIWYIQAKYRALDGLANKYFGISISISDTSIAIGAYGDGDNGSYAGAAYFFEINDSLIWEYKQKILASDGIADDQLGFSVSVLGDTCVVGAWYEGEAGPLEHFGAAYIYIKTGDIWIEQQKITTLGHQDPAHMNGSLFSWSVALSTDIFMGGCPYDNNGEAWDNGSVFIFTRAGGTWSFSQKIPGPAYSGWGDEFGNSISISGDSCIIGGSGYDNRTGSAFVYTNVGGTWTLQQQLNAFDRALNDFFGYASGIYEDTCVVGAYGDEAATGAAYVYTRTAGVWSFEQKLVASDGLPTDQFGYSVAITEDMIVVGAYGVDALGTGSGAAYVFTRTAGVWTQTQKLVPYDNAKGDFFGWSVAFDSTTSLAIGARDANNIVTLTGAVYLYINSGGTWVESQKLIAPDFVQNHEFGYSVAINDGTLLVGAKHDDDLGANAGAAYIFSGPVPPSPPTYGRYSSGGASAGGGAGGSGHRKYRDIALWRPYKPG